MFSKGFFLQSIKSAVNPLPNDKFLDMTKLKAFADTKLKVANRQFFSLIEQKTLWEKEKGENDGYQHFSPFPTEFSKAFFSRLVKSRDCVVKG